MATQISNGTSVPHATDYSDLLDKLITFAIANGWVQLENTSDKVVLKGTGAGSDEIIVAIQKYFFGWNLNGYTGYQSGLSFVNQPGAIPNPSNGANPNHPSMPLWNSSIPYWFVVNGRRIIVVAKVSTTFQMAYLGWFLPYATPNQYPYPMFVGGSCGGANGSYTGVATINHAFWRGASNGVVSGVGFAPGGTKIGQQNEYAPAANTSSNRFAGMFPYATSDGVFGSSGNNVQQILGLISGNRLLYPVSWAVDTTGGYKGIIGDLDGLYFAAGGGSPEDIVTVGSDNYLLVNNVFRLTADELVAVKLV